MKDGPASGREPLEISLSLSLSLTHTLSLPVSLPHESEATRIFAEQACETKLFHYRVATAVNSLRQVIDILVWKKHHKLSYHEIHELTYVSLWAYWCGRGL